MKVKLGAQVAVLAAVLGLLGLLVWKVTNQTTSNIPKQVAAGKHPVAPGFILKRLDRSGTLSLASLKGKAVVLNFWASWCGPCKDEAPKLEAAWLRWRSQGLVVLGVDGSDDLSSDALHFMRKHGISYPAVRDHRYQTVGHYGVTGYPETYFVGRNGKLVGKHIEGAVSTSVLDSGIRQALRS